LVIDGSGNIIVAGDVSNGTDLDFALARYTSAGVLDSSFGTGGKVTTDFGGHNDIGYSVAIDGSNRIVVAVLRTTDRTTISPWPGTRRPA